MSTQPSLPGSIVAKPSFIEHKPLKFLIMDSPKDSNLNLYIKICADKNVKHIVRISEQTYRTEAVEDAGITMHVCKLTQ